MAGPRQSLPTRVEVDASGYATGGVISQKHPDGFWHPIAYRSQSMTEAERNYDIYDREMLAICEALKDWRHFLEGLPQPFEIWTVLWFTPFFTLKRPPCGSSRSSRFLRALMRFPAFSVLCDALYSLFWLNAALRHSLGLGITPQQVTINPTQFCDPSHMDILLFSLGNPIVLLPCCCPSPCARTMLQTYI